MLTPFDAAAVLIVLAAVLGYFNHRVLKLPSSIGLTIMGAVASLIVVGLDRLLPGSEVGNQIVGFIAGIDFHTTLMDGMLSFLLFAGALHVKWDHMREGRWPIAVLSTVGVVLSTAIIGLGFHVIAGWLGLAVPIIWCLVFGALISPTDPVAVMGILDRAEVSPTLKATVAGESLLTTASVWSYSRSCSRPRWAPSHCPSAMPVPCFCKRPVVACCWASGRAGLVTVRCGRSMSTMSRS